MATTDDTETRLWAPRTRGTYTADRALFTDWCDATDHCPLPADPATVLTFLADCPAKLATRRRRVIAIDHQHTAAGHPAPGADPRVREAVGRPPTEPGPVPLEVRERVDAALRVLPSRGWTGGLFGRRDRCLLVLSQLARIPHKHLATLTAGDITLTAGAATITTAGQTTTLHAVEDPVLCGPCAIARWLHTHRVIVTKIATRAVADHLDKLTPLTAESPHVCRGPVSVDHRGARDPLLAPVNQWGHAPFPLTPMTPHAVSRQARDLLEGVITAHRVLPVHRQEPTEVTPRNQADDGAGPTPGYRPEQHRAALDRRRADLADLVGVAAELAAVDRRAAELDRRITQLLTLATAP